MAKPVVMPKPGITVEECVLTKWHKNPGDTVAAGDMLFSYETDKASFDEPSLESGELLACFYAEGDDVPALTNICVIGTKGEDAAVFDLRGATSSPQTPVQSVPETPKPTATQAVAPISATFSVATSSGAVSPRAKKIARQTGANLAAAVGTGPNGRIIERDVRDVLASGGKTAPVAAFVDIAHTKIRKVTAKAMFNSISSMAQLTHNSSFDATEIQNLREIFKNSGDSALEKITLNDMIMFAVTKTLTQFSYVNAHFYDDFMREFSNVNLGMAVDTDKGLLVPKVFSAEQYTLPELSAKLKEVAKAAQSGKISPDLLSGGTFTVSNLGVFGIESFSPIINPPEVGILGVNNITYRLNKNGEIYPALGLSLTYDHRAIDGAPASRFLQALCKNLEKFSLLLA